MDLDDIEREMYEKYGGSAKKDTANTENATDENMNSGRAVGGKDKVEYSK